MEKKSILSACTIHAFEKGYRVIAGEVFSPSKKKLSLVKNDGGYLCFGIKYNGKSEIVKVHKMVAYQIFGEAAFKPGIHVRHLDGNKINNFPDNIAIGTAMDNHLDKKKEDIIKQQVLATSFAKKFDHNHVISLRKSGMSYGEIMKTIGAKSKSTIHFILKKSLTAIG